MAEPKHSNIEPSDDDSKPYVYRLTHKTDGTFYIGYREANKKPASEDLGKKYRTSSEVVKEIGFKNFNYEIIAEFINPDRIIAGDEAYWHEQRLIRDEINDPFCLNKHYIDPDSGLKKFACRGHTEEAKEKQRIASTGRKDSPETNLKRRARRHSQETIYKMRETALERDGYTSDEARIAMSKAAKIRCSINPTSNLKSQVKSYKLISPKGQIFIGSNLIAFCRDHSLGPDGIYKVCAGKQKHHRGWTGEYIND